MIRSTKIDEMIIPALETLAVTALKVLLIVAVATATGIVWVLFIRGVSVNVAKIDSVGMLLPLMQRCFAGVLTVVLGLELLETLRTYFEHHHVKLEVILIVAIIAVARHVIQLDFEHTSGPMLAGLSAVIVSLTSGYFLVAKARSSSPPDFDNRP